MTGHRRPNDNATESLMTSTPDVPAAYDRWARYYDIGEIDRLPYLDYYASLLGPGDCSVLEIACGTGVMAAALAQRIASAGHAPRVAGSDISEAMLEIARARHPTLEWVCADMRSDAVQGRFDLVFCCFNSLQFMPTPVDLEQAFAAARRHVEPDGRFAFDLYQPNLPYLRVARTDTLARTVVHEGRALQIRENSHYDEATRLLVLDWRLVPVDAPGEVLAATRFTIRQFTHEDVERALAATGWRILERYGDLDRSMFTSRSKKQILVCIPE